MKKTILGLISLTILAIILNGFAIKQLWEWFVSNHFNIKELTIPVAIGISILVNMFKTQTNDNDDTDIIVQCVKIVAFPILALIFGFICQLFI